MLHTALVNVRKGNYCTMLIFQKQMYEEVVFPKALPECVKTRSV